MSVVEDVAAEEARQDARWGEQNYLDGTGEYVEAVPLWPAGDLADYAKNECTVLAEAGLLTWRQILFEEVCEAFAESDIDKLRAELVQVAAVAQQWARAIDRRREPEVPC